MREPVRRALLWSMSVLVSTALLGTAAAQQKADFSVEDEYADAKYLANGIRQWEASPKRTLLLGRFQAIEAEYLPRAERQARVTSTARTALDQHKARETDFLGKLEAIKKRSAENTGPGSAWRAELAQLASAYSGYLKEWDTRRKDLSAQLSASTAEIEQSRAPLKEFQRIYHALYYRRVAHQPGMSWEELVAAEGLAFVVRRCYEATLVMTHGTTKPTPSEQDVPAAPFATLHQGPHSEEWVRRIDVVVPGMEVDAGSQPATIVCVREVDEVIGHYVLPSGMRVGAVSVQWHVLLVRASDGAVLGTKVLYGAPPPDTATVRPTMPLNVRGKAPTPADLAEWLTRRMGAAAPRK